MPGNVLWGPLPLTLCGTLLHLPSHALSPRYSTFVICNKTYIVQEIRDLTIMPPSEAVRLFPRHKKHEKEHKRYRRNERHPRLFDVAAISKYFSYIQSDAAMKLGISVSALKQVCRKLGIRQWPGPARRPKVEPSTDKLKSRFLIKLAQRFGGDENTVLNTESTKPTLYNSVHADVESSQSNKTKHIDVHRLQYDGILDPSVSTVNAPLKAVATTPVCAGDGTDGCNDDMEWLMTAYQGPIVAYLPAASDRNLLASPKTDRLVPFSDGSHSEPSPTQPGMHSPSIWFGVDVCTLAQTEDERIPYYLHIEGTG